MAFMIPAVGAPQANSGGGGSDLPPVTTDDNGDVLTVVNGAWDKAAPSGGGALIVDTEILHGDTIKCLITAGEMLAAAKDGSVIIKFSFGGEDFYFNVIQFSYNSSAPSWNFVTLNPDLDGSFLQFMAVEESGYPMAPLA